MAKKSSKVALAYFLTIVIALLIFGGLAIFLMKTLVFGEKKENTTNENPMLQTILSDEYVPSNADNQTLLLIIDTEKRQTASCFLLIKMLPVERKLVFMPVPSDTFAEIDGVQNSVYEFYRTEGVLKAAAAVESATTIKADKYLKLKRTSLNLLVEILGGIDFNVPQDLIYENPSTGEETVIREGLTYLDAVSVRKVITFPNFKEEYRAQACAIIAVDLINKNVVSGFSSRIDNYFTDIINADIDTNISIYDYQEKSEAIKYIADNTGKSAQLVSISGSYNDSGFYVLDKALIDALPEWFMM